MATFATTFATIMRDYATDGVPASGVHKPTKAQMRAWALIVEAALTAIGTEIAALSVGGIGTYGLFRSPVSTIRAAGATLAGSSLLYTNALGTTGGGAPSGTWRLMGAIPTSASGDEHNTSVWLRIS
jgi:hypothetical protein